MKLRLCHHKDFPGLLQFSQEKKTFTGTVGPLLQDIIDVFNKYGNFTIEYAINQGIGVKNEETGEFDGCIGRLQTNESDLMMLFSQYPMDAVNITQGMVAYDTTLVIGGMYGKANITRTGQILDSFQSFTPPVWAICVFLCCLLSAVAWIRSRIFSRSRVRRQGRIFYCTITHCTRQGELTSRGYSNKIIYLAASIYSLLVLHYFSSYIKTELVTIEEPQVFYTYQDIIERKALPIFPRGLAYDQFFRGKRATEERQKLWLYATRRFGEDNLYIEMNPVNVFVSALTLLEQKAVMIMETVMMPILPNSGCPFAEKGQDKLMVFARDTTDEENMQIVYQAFDLTQAEVEAVRDFTHRFPSRLQKLPRFLFHISRDPSETSFLQGLLMSDHSSDRLKKSFNRLARRLIEVGFNLRALEILGDSDLVGSHPAIAALGVNKRDPNKMGHERECKSANVVKPEAEYHSLTAKNMFTLIILVLVCYVSLSFLLLMELFIHKTCERTSRKLSEERIQLFAPDLKMQFCS